VVTIFGLLLSSELGQYGRKVLFCKLPACLSPAFGYTASTSATGDMPFRENIFDCIKSGEVR